jgi:hypothetical protein
MDLPGYEAADAAAKEVALLVVCKNKLCDVHTILHHAYMSAWQDEMDFRGATIWTWETIHMSVPLCPLMWENVLALGWPHLPDTRTFVVESRHPEKQLASLSIRLYPTLENAIGWCCIYLSGSVAVVHSAP